MGEDLTGLAFLPNELKKKNLLFLDMRTVGKT